MRIKYLLLPGPFLVFGLGTPSATEAPVLTQLLQNRRLPRLETVFRRGAVHSLIEAGTDLEVREPMKFTTPGWGLHSF